jgi:hypothetical protein
VTRLVSVEVRWQMWVEFDLDQVDSEDPSDLAWQAAASAQSVVEAAPLQALQMLRVTLPDGSAFNVDVTGNIVRPATDD